MTQPLDLINIAPEGANPLYVHASDVVEIWAAEPGKTTPHNNKPGVYVRLVNENKPSFFETADQKSYMRHFWDVLKSVDTPICKVRRADNPLIGEVYRYVNMDHVTSFKYAADSHKSSFILDIGLSGGVEQSIHYRGVPPNGIAQMHDMYLHNNHESAYGLFENSRSFYFDVDNLDIIEADFSNHCIQLKFKDGSFHLHGLQFNGTEDRSTQMKHESHRIMQDIAKKTKTQMIILVGDNSSALVAKADITSFTVPDETSLILNHKGTTDIPFSFSTPEDLQRAVREFIRYCQPTSTCAPTSQQAFPDRMGGQLH